MLKNKQLSKPAAADNTRTAKPKKVATAQKQKDNLSTSVKKKNASNKKGC
jgi:hypothetical protein